MYASEYMALLISGIAEEYTCRCSNDVLVKIHDPLVKQPDRNPAEVNYY